MAAIEQLQAGPSSMGAPGGGGEDPRDDAVLLLLQDVGGLLALLENKESSAQTMVPYPPWSIMGWLAKQHSMLFVHWDGTLLTRFPFISLFMRAIVVIGAPSKHFAAHSFHIGIASRATAAGLSLEAV